MTYKGTVKGGVVVLESGAALVEGTEVRVEPVENPTTAPGESEADIFAMSELAVDTGVPDLATNIDHYLYGHPKVDHAG